MTADRHRFTAELWEHDGAGSWHFLSLPEDDTDEIDAVHGGRARGFGSQRVEVTIGATTWRTSIFPDTKRGTFVLPVKKPVRVAERLAAGDPVEVSLKVLDAG